MHGQHGHPGHHVLEPAIGLEPADAPAELLRQGVAVQRRRASDQRAQQRHFLGAEVAAVIAALDPAGHPAAMKVRLRSSFIDHGSHGDRSSGGRPAFFAHASSHAPNQRRTSMPFNARVPTTEYITAVNRAPFSLSEPNDSRLPIAGPLSTLSARLLSGGTWGRSTKTHSPSRWFTSERSALETVKVLNLHSLRNGARLRSRPIGRWPATVFNQASDNTAEPGEKRLGEPISSGSPSGA